MKNHHLLHLPFFLFYWFLICNILIHCALFVIAYLLPRDLQQLLLLKLVAI